MKFLILWLRVWSLSYETKEKLKAFIYNGSEQFGHYWVLPGNYKYLVTDLNMSMADQDEICKLDRVCCALPLDPWSQYSSEMKEDFIGQCCQPSKYSTLRFFFFSEFPVEKKKHFLTSYHESKYLSTLAFEVAETLLRYSSRSKFRCNFSRNHFATCSSYCNFLVPQSSPIFIHIYSNQIYLPCLHVLQFL